MKRVYWKGGRMQQTGLVVATMLALTGVAAVEAWPSPDPLPEYEARVDAAERMTAGLAALKEARLARGFAIDKTLDPAEIGLIGARNSVITSTMGSLTAKRLSMDPGFAAVVVDLLVRAGAQKGDVVAIGASGSFPALNLASVVASEALGLRPVLIASVSASRFGANLPGFTWLDMEAVLFDRKIIATRASGASMGAHADRADNLQEAGRAELRAAMQRNKVVFIEAPTVRASINTRMKTYRKAAAGVDIAAYINIGGGVASRGPSVLKRAFPAGLTATYPAKAIGVDAVMTRSAAKGVPVINLSGIATLARRYGLHSETGQPSPVGDGPAYRRPAYRAWLAGVALALVLVMLAGLRWMDRSRTA